MGGGDEGEPLEGKDGGEAPRELRAAVAARDLARRDHEDLLLVASHFDVDNSGAIDLAEFQDMVQVLCCGGNDVAAAIESVTRRKIAERAVTTHEPPPHEASALQAHDFLSLTQMQLHNKLDELRTRLKVRRQHDANHSLEAQGRGASFPSGSTSNLRSPCRSKFLSAHRTS